MLLFLAIILLIIAIAGGAVIHPVLFALGRTLGRLTRPAPQASTPARAATRWEPVGAS
jgi:hypothetical protein